MSAVVASFAGTAAPSTAPHMHGKCELLRGQLSAAEVRHLEVKERLAASPGDEGAEGRGSLNSCGRARQHLDL